MPFGRIATISSSLRSVSGCVDSAPHSLGFESPTSSKRKKDARVDVLSKSNWRRAGDSGMHAHAAPLRRFRALRAALANAHALTQLRTLPGSNPRSPPKRKKDARVDVLSKSNWRRAGDSNPRCPFGAYSLSRRAPSASRSALRNSRFIVTKQARMGKREFATILCCR